MLVTFMRALGDAGVSHVPSFRDPTAREFLEPLWRRSLDRIAQRRGSRLPDVSAARTAADMMALRTLTIDAAVRAEIARGTRQVVILGAGLDGRAWRMAELAGVRVFEVDFPATQELKRELVKALPPSPADVVFAPVDFEHDVLEAVLAGAGHDPNAPTCWIWEGVVMYLSEADMRGTLGHVARASAPGSALVLNYHSERRPSLVGLLLRYWGEPVKSYWSKDQMGAILAAAGFSVEADTSTVEWIDRYAEGQVRIPLGLGARIAVARRT